MAEHTHTSMYRVLFVHLVTHSASPVCTLDTTESFSECCLVSGLESQYKSKQIYRVK